MPARLKLLVDLLARNTANDLRSIRRYDSLRQIASHPPVSMAMATYQDMGILAASRLLSRDCPCASQRRS